MTTEVVFRPDDRVRHSKEFMRCFTIDWRVGPGNDEYEYIAQAEGRVMLDIGNGQYMVEWQHHEFVDEDDRQMFWHWRDMVPA